MDPIDRLTSLIEDSIVPRLDSLSDEIKGVNRTMQKMMLGHERHNGRIERVEEKVDKLPCSENTNILRGHGSRIAQIESQIKAGHNQNQECRDKNKLVEEALQLAKANRKQNEEQEKRHKEALQEQKERNQKIINSLWVLISGVAIAAAAGWFNHFFK